MSLLLLLRGGAALSTGYRVAEIPTASLGTKTLLVWHSGVLHQRVTTEGTAPVIVNGQLRLIQSGETLQS